MKSDEPTFADAVRFHGHSCPGLAFGFRVVRLARRELGLDRAEDEELVAVVENDSCAVDAIQLMTGCTFGKGNLVFHDYGKQVYTFFQRSSGRVLRVAVDWEPSPESPEESAAWEKFSRGERSPEVVRLVQARKAAKMKEVLEASNEQLFLVSHPKVEPPARARIFQSRRCSRCGEKVMSSRLRQVEGKEICIPCAGE